MKKKQLEYYPSIPLENVVHFDFNEIKKNIFSIKNNSKEPFNYNDKKKFFKELQKEDFSIDSLRKDIESIEKKYHLRELINNIIHSYYDKLKNLSDDLEKLWNERKKNIFLLSNELEDLIETYKNFFNLNDYYNSNKISFEGNNIDNMIFHKKNNVLPRIKGSRNFPVLKNFFHTNSDYSEKQINFLTNDLDSSSESNYSLNNLNSFKNGISNDDSVFELNKFLLSESNIDQLSKKPRKNSIRMSIFVQNKMKMDNLTPAKLMKLKKKKKKII